MRLKSFESAGLEPLGEGEEKRTFVNPEDETRIVSEKKEGAEKDTHRQLKGRYYLTKIVHNLLPNNIPDVYNAGESIDGKQIIDAERISHTPGHKFLQKVRQSGGNEEVALEQMNEEMSEGIGDLDSELERIGFSFNIDKNIGNYTKDKAGNIYYLETFKPWEVDPTKPEEFELLFNEEELRAAIESIPDQEVKQQSLKYLDRLLVLFEEDKKELLLENKAAFEALADSGPGIKELEDILKPFLEESFLQNLNSLKTKEEAVESAQREYAKAGVDIFLKKLKFLQEETKITNEELNRLDALRRVVSRAIGMVKLGMVDHSR